MYPLCIHFQASNQFCLNLIHKYLVSHIVSFPLLNHSPSVLAVLLVVIMIVVLLSCCYCCLCYFVAVLPTPLQSPSLARRCHHRCWLARRMAPATRTLTAAPQRRRTLSAGHWKPVRCWTGPSWLVGRTAKAAMMMAAPAVAAEVGSHSGLVWFPPPPPKAA